MVNHHLNLKFKLFALLFCLFQASTPVFAGSADTLVPQLQNFNALTVGTFDGQDDWVKAGGTWTVESDGGGGNRVKVVASTNQDTSHIMQTGFTVKDSRVVVDFQAPTGGSFANPHLMLRANGTASSANYYDFFRFGGTVYLGYGLGQGNGNFTNFASTSYSFTAGNWYTAEFEAVDNGSAEPVLRAWIYPQGDSKPGSPTLSYTDTAKLLPNAGYIGLSAYDTSELYDNLSVYYGDTSAPAIPIGLSGTPGEGAVSLSWTAPASGDTAITDYTIKYRKGTDAFQTFVHAPSTATAIDVTGLSNGTSYDFRVYGVSSTGTGLAAITTASTLPSNITITTPSRSVAEAPEVATITIDRTECSSTFSIPYIQTSTTLAVESTVSSGPPVGGGVKFVLTKGLTQAVQYDMSAPFSANFTGLAKGEYTLDVYIVDSGQVVQSGSLNHDQATNIGIGDIYVAIGDSITEGYDGTGYDVDPYEDWLSAPIASTDNRNYPQCGPSTGFYRDNWQEASHHISLNNQLESFFDYPVFILNEGFAGITTSGYATRMGLSSWQNRINALDPNKWLVHLGVNDTSGSPTFQSHLQTVIDGLIDTYNASPANIFLAVPSYGADWQPYINNLISANELSAGPNLIDFHDNHVGDVPALFASVHPTVAGHTQFSRLWFISMIYPENVSVSQNAGTITLTWDSLAPLESSLVGYKVKYGTTSGVYTTTVDVGNVVTTTVTGLVSGQTYYFAVSAYDNDAILVNETSNSPEVSIVYDTTPPTANFTSATDNAGSVTGTLTTGDTTDDTTLVLAGTNTSGSTVEVFDGVGSLGAATVSGTAWSYTATIVDGVTYQFNVKETDAAGNESTATSNFAVTGDMTPPATPTASPDAGTYTGARSVTLDSAGSDSILYTLDGSTPSCSVGTVYGGAFNVATSQTVTVIACDTAGNESSASFIYVINTNSGSGGFVAVYQPPVLSPTKPGIKENPVSPVVSRYIFTKTLRSGSIGVEVKLLQQYLNAKGFTVAKSGAGSPGKETFRFGSATRNALMRYQRANKLKVDGIFGPKSRGSIKNI